MTDEQKQIEAKRQESEIANLKDNSPFVLPDNPSASGWSTKQIKEKFYKAIIILYDYLIVERNRITTLEEQGVEGLTEAVQNIVNGVSIVAKAIKDQNGDVINLTYAKILELQNGAIAVKKYIASDNSQKNISDLESAINSLEGGFTDLMLALASGTNKPKNAENADLAGRAVRDQNGNVINTTYATNTALDAIRALFIKIENGTSIARKAYGDQNGAVIDVTYVKKDQIVNDLISTATNQPLSAYMGKVLYGYIQTIQTLLSSNDTDLDTVQEIVTYIKNNKSVLDTFSTSKVNVSDIVDDLLSNVSNKPLSAKQGYLLKGYIDNIISGVTVVKEAEKATKDSDGNNIAATYVKSINGQTPVNGNVVLGGFLGFQTYENGDYLKLKAVWSGDLGGEIGVLEQGDYKYLTYTPTGSNEYVILNRIAQSDAKISFAFESVCEAVIQHSMREINHYIAYLVEED